MSVIDMGTLAFDDLEKVFEVSSLLDNTEELLVQFKPEVDKYLVKEGFFKGPYLMEYRRQFDGLIVRLIKKEIVKHYPNYTPEEIIILSDPELLKILGAPLFDQNNYKVNTNLN